MAAANRTIYAILGLLAAGPKSGYELKQVVESTISHFWKESYGHIYPTLSRLTADGLVEQTEEKRGRDARRTRYSITPQGRLALEAWLTTPLEQEGVRNEIALRLYLGTHAPVSISRSLLETYQAHHRDLLQQYHARQPAIEARANAGETAAIYELITLSLGMHVSTARIAWCDDALRRLNSLKERDELEENPS